MRILCLAVAFLLFAGSRVAAADDLENAFQSLQQAETQKDAALVKRLAVEVYTLAAQVIKSGAPQGEEEKESWTNRVTYVQGIAVRTEYALYRTAVQSPPATLIDLFTTLEQLNPKSKYLDAGYGSYLLALTQTGASAKVPGVAEKALANFPENEDLLLVVADSAFSRKQTDRALNYATRLITALNKHSKPEGLPAADWERKRKAALGRGYWMAGVIHGEKGVYASADKELRSALPLISGDAMRGAALFYLGTTNYHLAKMTVDKARMLEAAKFSEEAAGIEGPYADQARHNALVSKTEAGRMR